MFEGLKEKQRQREAQKRAERETERKAEKEKLMQLSEKELLVELILTIKEADDNLADRLESVKRTVRLYGD